MVEDADEIEEKAAEGGLLGMLVPPVLAGLAALAISGGFVPGIGPTRGPSPEQFDQGADAEAGAQGEKKGDRKKKGKPETSPLVIFPLEPFIVSLDSETQSHRRVPRIRVILAVEGNPDLFADETRVRVVLRDSFTSVIKGYSAPALNGPDGLEALRLALLDEAQAALGDGAVTRILITDFLLT